MCLTSMIGVTYALFTSDPQKGTIDIQASTAKIDIDIQDAKKQSLANEQLAFVTTSENDTLYFEPGATFYTQPFTIVNEGTVPVNYRMYIKKDQALPIENFERVFDVYVTSDPLLRPTETGLGFYEGELAPGERTAPLYLVVKMKEDADNTYQNAEAGIGITVFAVQGNADITGWD